MQFIKPDDLTRQMDRQGSRMLLIFIDRDIDFPNHGALLSELHTRFGGKITIEHMDIVYRNLIREKFHIRGVPAFIYLENGRKKDVLLGVPSIQVLQDFVIKNL